jgi:hypothetical protein
MKRPFLTEEIRGRDCRRAQRGRYVPLGRAVQQRQGTGRSLSSKKVT